jgi:hypothetical protein
MLDEHWQTVEAIIDCVEDRGEIALELVSISVDEPGKLGLGVRLSFDKRPADRITSGETTQSSQRTTKVVIVAGWSAIVLAPGVEGGHVTRSQSGPCADAASCELRELSRDSGVPWGQRGTESVHSAPVLAGEIIRVSAIPERLAISFKLRRKLQNTITSPPAVSTAITAVDNNKPLMRIVRNKFVLFDQTAEHVPPGAMAFFPIRS